MTNEEKAKELYSRWCNCNEQGSVEYFLLEMAKWKDEQEQKKWHKIEEEEIDFDVKWEKEKLIDKLFPIYADMSDKELYEWAFCREGARALLDYLIDNEVDLTSLLNK